MTRDFTERATGGSGLAFINREEAIVQRQSQQRQAGAYRGAKLPLDAAVRVLNSLELPHEQRVPFFPGLDVALKQGLSLVITSVLLPGTLVRGVFELLREIAERGLILRQVLAAGDG